MVKISRMIDKELKELIVLRLVEAYHPQSIILFGSHAWGKPGENSDIDLLIIVDQSGEMAWRRSLAGIRSLKGLGIAKDILVLTRDEYNRLGRDEASLFFKIKKEGRILYEAA